MRLETEKIKITFSMLQCATLFRNVNIAPYFGLDILVISYDVEPCYINDCLTSAISVFYATRK